MLHGLRGSVTLDSIILHVVVEASLTDALKA